MDKNPSHGKMSPSFFLALTRETYTAIGKGKNILSSIEWVLNITEDAICEQDNGFTSST